jgi:hypothetical protein
MATELPSGPQPTDTPDLGYDDSLSGDLTFAARALTLGAALHAPDAIGGLDTDLSAVGFRDVPPPVRDYRALLSQSDDLLAEFNLLQVVSRREQESLWRPFRALSVRPQGTALWNEAAVGDPVAAVSWLRTVHATEFGLRQVSAAAALQPTNEEVVGQNGLVDEPAVVQASREVLVQASAERVETFALGASPSEASTSSSLLARQLASAALDDALTMDAEEPAFETDADDLAPVSTIIHGTAAYAGAWWTPTGDFHRYLKGTVSRDLYSDGQYYQWSGKYSPEHREVAAQRLVHWAAPYGGRLRRVFAHSYGGIIVLRALGLGLEAEEVVLLSTPAERVETDWSNAGRVCSLRIHFDLVLLAARRRQTFDLPVAEFHLPRWFINHGDTHETNVWMQHDVARAMRLH